MENRKISSLTMNEKISNLIKESFGEQAVLSTDFNGLQGIIVVQTNLIAEISLLLRNHPTCYFDYLSCLSGADLGLEKNQFAVVYHLSSITLGYQIVLKVIIDHPRDTTQLPIVPTVSQVWRTADWHEREAYDLVGIYFEGHPDLRRILCPDDWEGYALRKDYVAAESYGGLKINGEVKTNE
jgi:NADH-quinone oxidoreductase subunit C